MFRVHNLKLNLEVGLLASRVHAASAHIHVGARGTLNLIFAVVVGIVERVLVHVFFCDTGFISLGLRSSHTLDGQDRRYLPKTGLHIKRLNVISRNQKCCCERNRSQPFDFGIKNASQGGHGR